MLRRKQKDMSNRSQIRTIVTCIKSNHPNIVITLPGYMVNMIDNPTPTHIMLTVIDNPNVQDGYISKL